VRRRKSLFGRPPATDPLDTLDGRMALFQLMDNANAWLANAGEDDAAARESVQVLRDYALGEILRRTSEGQPPPHV
jgi:hypothetical protein